MPTYYLHLREQGDTIRDLKGAVFADIQAARDEARRTLRAIVAEHLYSGETLRIRSIEIHDEMGAKVDAVSLASAISAVIPIAEVVAEIELGSDHGSHNP
ncbi:hypothetical protein KX729_30320 [Rhizobium sp. XQZ8]|uniref:DUF6894 family protein n=1 Tax=Rhizobium populisoli TaxID=2859785 RepID=UPI001CA4FA56|nr:hypothetical protein [Rhizobium populisoli]MBW6425690.1 hypothetical protein [Rhizobium populisoli]